MSQLCERASITPSQTDKKLLCNGTIRMTFVIVMIYRERDAIAKRKNKAEVFDFRAIPPSNKKGGRKQNR
jgi:hypothetical protein